MRDVLLHGKASTKNIVGVYQNTDNSVAVIRRNEDTVIEEQLPFYSMLWVNHTAISFLQDNFNQFKVASLDGPGRYDRLLACNSVQQFWEMRRGLTEAYGSESCYIVPSMETQFLMQTGETVFGGMSVSDVRRMQVDIETYTEEGFPNADRLADEITIISLSDNTGFECVLHTSPQVKNSDLDFTEYCKDEKEMLIKLVTYIHRRNPDVIEGHNIFGFDLPYIRDRCRIRGVEFRIGRDGSEPHTFKSTVKFAEREFDYENFQIAGRSVVDTMFLALSYDVYKRDLPNYKLKDIAIHFGVAPEGRTYVEGSEIPRVWREDPQRLLQYGLDDVYETRSISEYLLPASFELAKLVPFTLQRTTLAGTSATLESLMVREYLRLREALPDGDRDGGHVRGGYTDIFRRGAYGDFDGNLNYADVESLYPSIMLHYNIQPKGDSLKLFGRLLKSLTDMRFDSKNEMRRLKADGKPYKSVDAQQSAYKILINSAYGMCGFPFAVFSDLAEADRVTRTGQQLLRRMLELIKNAGGTPILADTDGVLYELPQSGMSDADVDQFIEQLSAKMPKGIVVGNDGRFDRVFAYRKKNYVLLPAGSDKIKIKGQSFKGRSLEPFLSAYIEEIVNAFIVGNVDQMTEVHKKVRKMIVQQKWTIEQFQNRSTLKKSMREYQNGLKENVNKHPMPQYEVAKRLLEQGRDVRRGDVVHWFVSGSVKAYKCRSYVWARDSDSWMPGMENTYHYLARLKTVRNKWKPFFSEDDFERIFSMNVADDLQGGNLFGRSLIGDTKGIINSEVSENEAR